MSYVTGTATDAQDLFTKLQTFLKTDATLVAANQQWTVAWDTPAPAENQTDVVLLGPGLSQQDQVYVGMRLTYDAATLSYYIETVGMTGVRTEGTRYNDHVNVTPFSVTTFLENIPMTYWFVASGRRFVIVVKISGVYETLYAGLYLPYATPLSYPYPLLIGGSAGDMSLPGSPVDWRSEVENHRHFIHGDCEFDDLAQAQSEAACWLLMPDAMWDRCADFGSPNVNLRVAPRTTEGDYFNVANDQQAYLIVDVMERLIDCFGGERMVWPTVINRTGVPDSEIYGIFDGCSICQGQANAAENTITISGVPYLVVQNVFRTGTDEYWALALE